MKLFGKRYGRLYDTHVSAADAEKKGFVTYQDYMNMCIKQYSVKTMEKV